MSTTILDQFASRDEWLGFGYLGERARTDVGSDVVAAVDEFVCSEADRLGMTQAELFAWANSKDGRYFGDVVLGGSGPLAERFEEARRFGVAPHRIAGVA